MLHFYVCMYYTVYFRFQFTLRAQSSQSCLSHSYLLLLNKGCSIGLAGKCWKRYAYINWYCFSSVAIYFEDKYKNDTCYWILGGLHFMRHEKFTVTECTGLLSGSQQKFILYWHNWLPQDFIITFWSPWYTFVYIFHWSHCQSTYIPKYVCMYIHTYTHVLCIYTHTHTHTCLHICMYIRTYILLFHKSVIKTVGRGKRHKYTNIWQIYNTCLLIQICYVFWHNHNKI
jgi:hypothetical protein